MSPEVDHLDPFRIFMTDDPNGYDRVMIGDTKKGSKYIESTARKIRKEGLKKTRQVKPGDFLLTNSMSFWRPYIMKTPGCVHDGWLILSPKSDQISTDCFYHPMALAGYLIRGRVNNAGNPYYTSAYLNSRHGKQTLLNMCKSIVGMANINAWEMQDIKILIPPVEQQNNYQTIEFEVLNRVRKMSRATEDQADLFNSLSQKAFARKL